jgi:hypothetical protein
MAGVCYTIDDINGFLVQQLGRRASNIGIDDDLNRDHGLEGDEFSGLMARFGSEFGVDLSTYRWYFHHGEEPHWGAFFQLLFRAPYQRVKQIPISPKMLLASANAGRWLLEYPSHSLPERRYDAIAAWCFVLLLPAVALGLAFLFR